MERGFLCGTMGEWEEIGRLHLMRACRWLRGQCPSGCARGGVRILSKLGQKSEMRKLSVATKHSITRGK